MKKAIFLYLTLFFSWGVTHAQEFDNIISSTADTLVKKIVSSQRKTVAITDFINLDESITQLGTFLSEEVSSELSNLTDNQKKFRILERSKLEQIFKEKNLIQSTDGSRIARKLGELAVADVLIFATITDFNGYYRVVMKLLDTKTGDALSSLKVSFVKTPSLENLNKIIVKKGGQTQTTTPYLPGNTVSESKPVPSGCESQVGTLNVTNKTKPLSGVSKIVIRVPKSSYVNNSNDFYYLIIDADETKLLGNLKEGTYEYEAKSYDDSARMGWNGFFGSLSNGQIQITKCKTTELIIR